jgi:hypothetical protein
LKHAGRRNGAGRPGKANRSSADVAYHQQRRSDRDAADPSLLEAMRANPESTSERVRSTRSGRSSLPNSMSRIDVNRT